MRHRGDISGSEFGGGEFARRIAAAIPPIPSPANAVLIASLWNWNPVGYFNAAANTDDGNETWDLLATAPYAVDWAGGITQGSPPYLLNTFRDQLSANDLTQTGAARPTLDAVNKCITGAAGCGMVSANKLVDPGITAFTVYGAVKGNSEGVVFETGADGSGDATISIYFTAGDLRSTLKGNSGNDQTKIKTIADNTWHWVAVTGNTTLAAANQLILEVDNSIVGVTALTTQDLAAQAMGNANLSFFCRDAGGAKTNAYPGSGNTIYVNNGADDATTRTAYFKYWQYLMSTIGITV